MLSVIIIARNDEKLIKNCLESVKWADEIIVVDDGSTDSTSEVAAKYTSKVYEVKPLSSGNKSQSEDFSEKRNFGLNKATGDWILCVDTDERVLNPLKEEIQNIISHDTSEVAWKIPRTNVILGEVKKYKAFWPDYVIRLFKKEHLKGWQGKVHEQPEYEGKLGTIKNSFLHLTHRDIDSMVLKSLNWANIDAKLRLDAGHPPMSGPRFIKILFSEIWNQGVNRRGFFNGTVGVIDSLLQAFSLYITYVKLWQFQRSETLDETYEKIDKKLMESDFGFYK